MGNFMAKLIKQLEVGQAFITSNGLGDKVIGVIEPGAKGGLVPVQLDDSERLLWWKDDTEVVIEWGT